MSNLLKSGAAWLGQKLKSYAGHSVRLIVGAQSIAELTATVNNQTYDLIEANGTITSVISYDWTIVAADLIDDDTGEPIELRPACYIEETIGCTVHRYEAMKLGSRKCVEPFGASGVLLLLHTKKVLGEEL